MVNLMDFPDELLLQIIDETVPDGIEALARCSNRFSNLSKDALRKHEADTEKYEMIEIREDEVPGPTLIELVQNPRRGQYTRQANFEYCRQDVRVPLSKDIADDLTQALIQQPCVPLKELLHWVQEAASGNQDITVAILLLMLPDLETLIIPSRGCCESLIRRIIKWSQESIIPQPNLPLARLENVVIGDDEWDTGTPARFLVEHGLMVFRGLPSLKSLMCFYRTTRAMYSPNITLQFHDGRTKIHIYNIEISSEDFELIMQHLDNVTTFRYFDRYGSDNARYLDHVLLRYASHSLEDVNLQCPQNPSSELPNHGCHSLFGFAVLKRITIPQHTFQHGGRVSLSRPSLVDFLPSSVEEVTIVGPTTFRNAKKLLDQLAHAKAVQFPELKNVHMVKSEYYYTPSLTLATFEKAGITLDLDHVQTDDPTDFYHCFTKE